MHDDETRVVLRQQSRHRILSSDTNQARTASVSDSPISISLQLEKRRRQIFSAHLCLTPLPPRIYARNGGFNRRWSNPFLKMISLPNTDNHHCPRLSRRRIDLRGCQVAACVYTARLCAMDTLEADAKDVIRARYLVVATLAFQIYDYLTNLDDEIRLVWSDKLTIRQLHFFLNRYLPFATSILSVFFVTSNNDIKECSGGFAALVYISVIGMLIAEFSVFLRADAVWGHKRSVRILLVCTYVCSSGFILFIATRHVLSNTVIPLHISSGCLYIHGDRKIWAALMMYLFCDFLALALLLCKAFLDARYANSPMMRALSRDGIAYFSVITCE
ncbi:hypothetical protein DFH11DRAFT_648780 [Phellopilus nigrolimitatus]|nr:hypothetical protein DFH11DRAFT_648780 [Phellopilus nigrolimitatus]